MASLYNELCLGYKAYESALHSNYHELASTIINQLYKRQSQLPLQPHDLPTGPSCGYNKLGLHVLNSLTEDVVQTELPLFLVGEWGKVKGASNFAIGAKNVGYDAASQFANRPLDPEGAAEQFVADMIRAIGIDDHIKVWTGHNEFVPVNAAQMKWYARFEMARMRLMAQEGYGCVIGNFFTGGPEFWMWQYFLPAIQLATVYDNCYLGLHEYSNVAMNWMYGDWQGDPSEDAGDVGWGTLRYRMLYRYVLQPAGVASVPLVVTECGLDAGVIPPTGWQGGFFKDLIPQWQSKLHIGAEMYWDGVEHEGKQYCGLKWYNEELQKDDFVKAAFVFTYGNFGGLWQKADINNTVVKQRLLQYQMEHPQ